MKDMAGITFHPDRIFSQTVSGRPKTEVLSKLAERHPDASGLVFVEDKLSTLEKVRAAWRGGEGHYCWWKVVVPKSSQPLNAALALRQVCM